MVSNFLYCRSRSPFGEGTMCDGIAMSEPAFPVGRLKCLVSPFLVVVIRPLAVTVDGCHNT